MSITATWRALPLRTRLIVLAAAVVIVALVAMWFVAGAGACSSRADVEARVALVSSSLQQAAAQGAMNVEDLAAGIKRLNEAATAYEADNDAGAFCAALGKLSDDLKLAE